MRRDTAKDALCQRFLMTNIAEKKYNRHVGILNKATKDFIKKDCSQTKKRNKFCSMQNRNAQIELQVWAGPRSAARAAPAVLAESEK